MTLIPFSSRRSRYLYCRTTSSKFSYILGSKTSASDRRDTRCRPRFSQWQRLSRRRRRQRQQPSIIARMIVSHLYLYIFFVLSSTLEMSYCRKNQSWIVYNYVILLLPTVCVTDCIIEWNLNHLSLPHFPDPPHPFCPWNHRCLTRTDYFQGQNFEPRDRSPSATRTHPSLPEWFL